MRRFIQGISKEEEAGALEVLGSIMDEMEATLQKQDWLAGASYSLADIGVTPFVQRFEANSLTDLVDWDARPAVGAWWQRVKDRPSYQAEIIAPLSTEEVEEMQVSGARIKPRVEEIRGEYLAWA